MPPREALETPPPPSNLMGGGCSPGRPLRGSPPSNLIGGGWSRQVPPREALERLPSIKFDRGRGVGECPQGGF